MNLSKITNQRDPRLYGPKMLDGTYPTPERVNLAIEDGMKLAASYPDVVPHRAHHVVRAGEPDRPYARPPTPPQPLPDPNEGKWFFWELLKSIVTGKSDWDHQFDGVGR